MALCKRKILQAMICLMFRRKEAGKALRYWDKAVYLSSRDKNNSCLTTWSEGNQKQGAVSATCVPAALSLLASFLAHL